MRIYLRSLLTMLGGLSIGTLFHELYHWFTMTQPVQMCYVADDQAIMFVQGYGKSSEFWAYGITYLIVGLVFAFMVYDLIKSKDVK